MKLAALIKKHKINTSEIARKIGMSPTTFQNKLSGRLDSRFNDGEIAAIGKVLLKMKVDIEKYLK